MSDELLMERRDGALWCTINRPERRNALSAEVVAALRQALAECAVDDGIRALVLTGSGERAFCAGGDLSGGQQGPAQAIGEYAALLEGMRTCRVPLLARVNGHCVAGGMGLMLACDLAVACDEAEFATPEVRVGLFAMLVAPLLERHAGPKLAAEMLYAGRRLSAAEAAAAGLINRVVDRGQLDAECAQLVAEIARGGPLALAAGKRALHEVADLPGPQAAELLGRRFVELAASADAAEGVQAFLQKREPRWQGK